MIPDLPKENKPVATLKDWYAVSPVSGRYNVYTAPECNTVKLCGTVYNHPEGRHYDGKNIQTSRVLTTTDISEWSTVETYNTIYLLENMQPDYKEYLDGEYDKKSYPPSRRELDRKPPND